MNKIFKLSNCMTISLSFQFIKFINIASILNWKIN